jgi:hypothetical protein
VRDGERDAATDNFGRGCDTQFANTFDSLFCPSLNIDERRFWWALWSRRRVRHVEIAGGVAWLVADDMVSSAERS